MMTTLPSIPVVPGAWPLLGHLKPLLRDPLAFLASLPQHGDLVRIRLGPWPALVVCDPELTGQMLRDDRTFDKGGPLYDRLREITGDSVGSCPYPQHRRQRRLLQPAFHRNRFPAYAQAMAGQIDEATSKWRDGQILDVPGEMQTITARVLTATMFSDTLPPSLLRRALDDVRCLFDGTYRRMLTPPPLDRLPTPGNRRYHRARIRLRSTLATVIAERRRAGIDHGDLLSAMLTAADDAAADDPNGTLSDTEVADNVITFFLAGTENTANTLAWTLYLMTGHPDIEQRLHTEVDTVLAGRTPTHADLPALIVTEQAITETLRLWPPGALLTRVTTTDTQLAGYHIPAGTTIAYSSYLIHRRPDLYADPDRYDPARWAPDQPSPHRETFIPFGGGARKCIGDRFTITEATLALATITTRWRLHTLPGPPVRPRVGASISPHKLRMRVTIRGHDHPRLPTPLEP